MRRAPARGAHLGKPEPVGLAVESLTEVHVPRTRANRLATTPLDHLRTNFIARPAYAYARVHYNISERCPSS